jgi:hypothetical protein
MNRVLVWIYDRTGGIGFIIVPLIFMAALIWGAYAFKNFDANQVDENHVQTVLSDQYANATLGQREYLDYFFPQGCGREFSVKFPYTATGSKNQPVEGLVCVTTLSHEIYIHPSP